MQALAEAMQLACDAALAGDLDSVKARLQDAEHLDGYSINAKGTRSRTPLYQSCLGRNPDVALWLLEHGAQDEPEGCGYVAICATGKGSEDSDDAGERTAAIMRRFGFAGKPKKVKRKKKKKNSSTDQKSEHENKGGDRKKSQGAKKQSPAKQLELALAAAAAGETSLLLTQAGRGKNAELPIHHAARTRNVDALAVLLATDCAKEQLLSAGKGGKLPVHYAVETKDIASLQLMITVGGAEQLLQPDSNGRIALQCALSGSSTEVPLALLAAGKAEQCLVPSKSGGLPLHHAASMGDEQLLSALLSCGYAEQQSLSADKDGRLPAHNALRRASHTGGASRVASIKRCVGLLVDAAGTSQLGVRDSEGSLALDYVLAALAEAEASARTELEKAEQENSAWVQDLESNHKEALEALEAAHSAAVEEATRVATADAAAKVQEADGKWREAEGRAVAAEERTKELEAALSTASRQFEEELERQRAALGQAKAQVKVQQSLEGSYQDNDKGGAPRDSIESLPLSPPRGPGSLSVSGSLDGPLGHQDLQLPLESAALARFARESVCSDDKGDSSGSGYRYAQSHGVSSSTDDQFSKMEAKGREVVDIAGRVSALAQELSAMLAAPSG